MSFNGISGHTREIEALKNAITTGRVAHAYLFSGTNAIGKRLVAKTFAMALNCPLSPSEPCGVCVDCIAITDSTHQNLLEIAPSDKDGAPDPGGRIRIAEVRRLQEALRYRVESGKKVVIIDSADTLQPQAAHALLKTLEEPPPDSVLILISSRPTALLLTLLSRCQRVNFRPLEESVVRDFLVKRDGLSLENAASIARTSAGSLGTAIEYAGSDGLYEFRMEIAAKVEALRPTDTLGALTLALEMSKMGDIVEVLEFLKLRCRDSLASGLGVGALAVTGAGFSGSIHPASAELIEAFSVIELARADIAGPCNVNRLLRLESMLFSLMEIMKTPVGSPPVSGIDFSGIGAV